jgi:hypothetical protein
MDASLFFPNESRWGNQSTLLVETIRSRWEELEFVRMFGPNLFVDLLAEIQCGLVLEHKKNIKVPPKPARTSASAWLA